MTPGPYPASISVDGEDFAVMVTERSPTDFVAVIDGAATGRSAASLEGTGASEEAALAEVSARLKDALRQEDEAEES